MYPGVFMYTWETDHLTKFVGSDLIYGFVEFNLGLYPLLQLHEDRAIQLTLVYKYTHMHTHLCFSSCGIIFWKHMLPFLCKCDTVRLNNYQIRVFDFRCSHTDSVKIWNKIFNLKGNKKGESSHHFKMEPFRNWDNSFLNWEI